MNDFINKWMGKGHKVDWRKLSRRTIHADRWDLQDLDATFKIMPDFGKARDRLADTVSTAQGATDDTFFSFYLDDPESLPAGAIRPDYMINSIVRDELRAIPDWSELRALGTVGDDVSSALAFITMREDLETLFDKVKTEQEQAEKLAEKMQELQRQESEARDVEDMLNEMDQDDDGRGAAQAKLEAMQQAIDDLEQEIQDETAGLGLSLENKRSQIQQALRAGLNKAVDEAKDLDSIDQTWGTEAGTLTRLSAEKRLEMAKKIKDRPKLKKLAKLVGPMKRVMFGEQRKKAEHARDEVYDVELGDDLSRLLPLEFAHFHHPKLKKLFIRDLAEQNLMQYSLRGTERLGLGGIICAIDNSMSMAGDREIWGKAVGLSLLHLAKVQKRAFKGIHFASAGQCKEFDFDFTKSGPDEVQRIFDFAEEFFGGGTDFQVPLTAAVKLLREEFTKYGKVKGDIVFITDGECGVSDAWFEDFKAAQAEMNFQVFGVLVGATYGGGPGSVLHRICDGKVVTVRDLTSPNDVRDVFSNINSF